MNDKKPLMDYRRVQKLQTPLLLTGALLSGVGTSVSVPLVILGIAIMLFAIVIGVLYYRCPHCGRPLGRIGEGGAYCPHCGKAAGFDKETDTLDGWFDSGSTHFAAMERDQGFWPATMYIEGLDQYRGWFQSSLLVAVGALGRGAPFKECVTHGWTVDGEGKAMHKSLGNGMDPAEIFNKYGADLLRLWAGSSDYHVDVRCSDEIFKQLSQNYLKFRNTAKFCLDNLTGFDPETELVAPARMQELDRWAVTKLNDLMARCETAYQNYEFFTVSHAVNDFCVVTLSSLYLDIIKDRLYCEERNGLKRRSAQTALFLILDSMTKMFAPILAFTCDEIWQSMPHRASDDARNVLLNQMPEGFAQYALEDAAMEKWDVVMKLRQDVNGVLETARADKRIGKSLEAHVALFANDEDAKAALDAVKSVDLPEIFIVSNVSTNETAPAEGAVVGQGVNFPGLTVAVTDRDSVVAAAGSARRDLIGKRISTELEQIMEDRAIYRTQGSERSVYVTDTLDRCCAAIAAPIISEGDALGLVLFVENEGENHVGETEYKLAQTIASFLGRHMES